jgi:hypothetical protein
MTFPSHSMSYNYDTFELKRLMDLPVTTNISTYSDVQQLINQMEPLTWVVLVA